MAPPTILNVYSNDGAFCALKSDGTLQAWGHIDYGATVPTDVSNVKQIFCSSKSFTALTRNNSLITWGNYSDGSGNRITNANLVKRLQKSRMYGDNVISNVKQHNLQITNNYKFNNGNYERPSKQVISSTDYNFTKSFSEKALEKINKISSLTNGEITDDSLPTISVNTDKKRHVLLDTFFKNISDISFNISTKKIGMELKLSKSKTKVLQSEQTMDLTTSGTDLKTDQSVYSNLSGVNDKIIVNMENSVSFKVTRTTAKGTIGKYNVDVLSGKMVVYGRHYGTIEFGTAKLQLGPYQDGDEVYINRDKFYFGGFGCSELNKTSSDTSKLYLCVVTASEGVGVLFQDGSVKCFGRDYYSTSGKNVDSNVIKLVASSHHFVALKSDGSCIIWGASNTTDMMNKKFWINYRDTLTSSNKTIKFDNTKLLESDCIDIYSITGRSTSGSGTLFIKKSDGSIVILGNGHHGGTPSYYLNSSLISPDTQYNGGDGSVKADFWGAKLVGLSDIQYGPPDHAYWKGASINYKGKIVTWGGRGDVHASYHHGSYGENITHWEHGIEGERRSGYNWGSNNKDQNLTYDTLPPASKIILTEQYSVAIFNNGTIGLWGQNHNMWYVNRDGTREPTAAITIYVWNEIQQRTFVDGIDSHDNCALLDTSGGVIIFGGGCGEAFYSGAPNHLGKDISANVTKMLSNDYGGFAFLRSDNVAVIWRENSYTEAISIPEKFKSTMTIKGINEKERLIFPDIVDIYNAGYCDFFLKTSTGEGFLINCQKGSGGYIRDIGLTTGGSISAIKRVYTNGNATCILKEDNSLVQFYGSIETYMKFGSNYNDHYYQMATAGADYNHVDWGINGKWNGGNGKGGCVFNGDGSEQVLKNVKQIIPIGCNYAHIPHNYSSVGQAGFIAIIENSDNTQSLVMWGNTKFSHKYIEQDNNRTIKTVNQGGALSFPVVKSDFTNKLFSNKITNIRDSHDGARNNTILNQYKNMYPNTFKYGTHCKIIKLTVANNKFVFNNDTSAYTFEMGNIYIFDTSDSSNINNRLKICSSLNTKDTLTSVQFLTPGETNSFIRYIKMTRYTYIYCDVSGISMGSHYNSATEATELTTLSTVFGSDTEKNLISSYTSLPNTNIILDSSLNSITIDTEAKKKAIMEALFTVQPENYFLTKKNIFGYTKSVLGIASPLLYANKMKVINATSVNRGMSISGETVWSGAVDLGNAPIDECVYINMRDINDNISLCLGGSEYGYSSDFSTVSASLVKPGVEFILKRTTTHDVTARYEITFNSTFNTVYTSASNFNTSNNTGYFEENDLIYINDTEITFTSSGLITKGSAKRYTTITTTVNGESKFVFNGNSTTDPVLEYDKNYKFDVSDSSNTGYVLKFSKTNTTTEYNTKNYGTPGTSGAYVTFTPGAFSGAYVFCSTNGLNMGALYNPMLLNNGISKTILETIESDTIDNNITIPNSFYSNLTGADNLAKEGQKRRRRHQFLRTIFASNQTNTVLETSKTNLGFDTEYKKNTFKVFNPKSTGGAVTINVNGDSDLDSSTGFYSPLEDGDHALITNSTVTLKVSRTSSDSDGNGIYYVENNDSDGELFITETNSLTYKNNSSPAGPFKDGDTASINLIPLVFGGIGDGSSTNSSENPSVPTFTDNFESFSRIPIMGRGTYGFIGIANDGKLYGWGGSSQANLPYGDSEGSYSNDARISDISFCRGHELMVYINTEGRPKTINGSTSEFRTNAVNRTDNDGWNYWWNGDLSSNDFTDLSGVVDMFMNQSKNRHQSSGFCAVLLRNDGSIAFWNKKSPPVTVSTSLTNNYNYHTMYGAAAECLFNKNHINFSKIKKIISVHGTFILLREDGKVAFVHLIDVALSSSCIGLYAKWQGPNETSETDAITLVNSLTDDGSSKNPMKIFGNVVDIGGGGTSRNNQYGWLLNDKGQSFYIGTIGGTTSRQRGFHRSLSYDTTSPYFKKTVKIFTWFNYTLQVFEDGTTSIPYKSYHGDHNQNYDKTNPRELYTDDYVSRPSNRDVFDGKLCVDRNGIKLNYANSKSPRIKKYYGPLILLQDNTVVPGATIAHVSYGSGNKTGADWNHEQYGIYGTYNGYSAGEEPYGDLSNVKSIDWSTTGVAWTALLYDGRVLTWGKGNDTTNGLIANSKDVSNNLVNVKKIVINLNAAAALKNDGSVVCWGKSNEGGSFDSNTAGCTSTMSNKTLDSGVLDVFASKDTFTAVKSDGIIIWGKYKGNYDDTDNLTWTIDTNYIMRGDTLNAFKRPDWLSTYDNVRFDMNHIVHYSKYSNSSEQNNIASNLLDAGVSQIDIDIMLSYPKYLNKLDYFFIPTTCFSSGDKDIIRGLIIDLIFTMNYKIDMFKNDTEKLLLDSKINKSVVDIYKPNLGIIDLMSYKYNFKGFYCQLKENDNVNFKATSDDLIFRITKGSSNYTLTKLSGTVDLSFNKAGPYTEGSTVIINGKNLKFLNGVCDGDDSAEQKYNCIECSFSSAAYLDKSVGRVITWGNKDTGGYSHDDFNGTGRDTVTAYNNPGATLSSGVVSIAVSTEAFAALKDDGSVVVWGLREKGGDLLSSSYAGSETAKNLTSGVVSVHGCSNGLAALKANGDFYCWGTAHIIGTSGRTTYPSGQFPVKNVKKVFPSYYGFMLIKTDGSLSGIGDPGMGHNPSYLSNSTVYQINDFTENQFTENDSLQNVSKIYTGLHQHVAILNDACGNQIKIIGNSNYSKYFANDFKTRRWKKVVVSYRNSFAAIDISGGVVAWGNTNIVNGTLNNPTSGQWMDISGDVSSNVIRVMANKYAWMCLRSDNVLVSIRTGTSGTGEKCYDFENTDGNYKKPPSEYIISRYKLRNIKDIFASEAGFGAIDISDNVMCWGYSSDKYVNEVPHGYPDKIYGGDLSGNDISKNRPVALFSNGFNWCCLKEDETIVTWDRYNGADYDHGSNHLNSSHGVNSNRWGGSGNAVDGDKGGVRNGDGTIKVTGNVKNVVAFNTYDDNNRGYIAIQEDSSGNQSCVGWGGYSGGRESSNTPDNNNRSFRHIADHLTSHSPYQIGLDINGLTSDYYRWPWLRSNRENLHEYNEGDHTFTGNDIGFGSAVTAVEVYNVDTVSSDASDNGVSGIIIDRFANTKLNDVDETESLPLESALFVDSIDSTKTVKNIRKQRHNILKLAFANNPRRTKFKTTSGSLGYTYTTKPNIVIFKVNFGKVVLNMKNESDLDENTGFLIPIEGGHEATITNKEGDSTFKITRSEIGFGDGDGKYFVESVENLSMITNFQSLSYIRNSSPQGPFRDGDRAIVGGVPIIFGGLTEDDGNYSFGDPYINPIFGGITKLPDKKALYRLFQGKNMYINCSVDKISEKKQRGMEEWFYKKTGFDSKLFGFITSGYFYNKIYITSENNDIVCDFDTQSMTMDEKAYFTIKNTYEVEKENKFILNERCSVYTISWPHEEYNHVAFTVKIYENPQIDNAVSIQVAGNLINCEGLLVRNYKPELMEIDDIKMKNDRKLNKRLKNTKQKFAVKTIKDKNEVWIKIKE